MNIPLALSFIPLTPRPVPGMAKRGGIAERNGGSDGKETRQLFRENFSRDSDFFPFFFPA